MTQGHILGRAAINASGAEHSPGIHGAWERLLFCLLRADCDFHPRSLFLCRRLPVRRSVSSAIGLRQCTEMTDHDSNTCVMSPNNLSNADRAVKLLARSSVFIGVSLKCPSPRVRRSL